MCNTLCSIYRNLVLQRLGSLYHSFNMHVFSLSKFMLFSENCDIFIVGSAFQLYKCTDLYRQCFDTVG